MTIKFKKKKKNCQFKYCNYNFHCLFANKLNQYKKNGGNDGRPLTLAARRSYDW